MSTPAAAPARPPAPLPVPASLQTVAQAAVAQKEPLVVMVTLFILVPSLSGAVGLMVPVGALIAIGVARILYNKNLL